MHRGLRQFWQTHRGTLGSTGKFRPLSAIASFFMTAISKLYRDKALLRLVNKFQQRRPNCCWLSSASSNEFVTIFPFFQLIINIEVEFFSINKFLYQFPRKYQKLFDWHLGSNTSPNISFFIMFCLIINFRENNIQY